MIPLRDTRGRLERSPDGNSNLSALLARLYGSAAWLHRRLASRAQVRTTKPLISLGNIESGGTGKTPAALALAKLLLGAGFKPGILTGLAGQGGGAEILQSGDPGQASSLPDEARLLALHLPGVPIVAARRKWRGALILDSEEACEVILLDDGFQHHRLARDLDLILISGREELRSGRVLPAGSLREFPSALRAADALLLREGVAVHGLPAETTRFHYTLASSGLKDWKGEAVEPDPSGYVGISGIAAPERFEDSANSLLHLRARLRFRDHAPWSEFVAREIAGLLEAHPGSRPLVSAKDAARWQGKWDLSGERPHVLDVNLRWSDPGRLLRWLQQTLSAQGRPLGRDQSSTSP